MQPFHLQAGAKSILGWNSCRKRSPDEEKDRSSSASIHFHGEGIFLFLASIPLQSDLARTSLPSMHASIMHQAPPRVFVRSHCRSCRLAQPPRVRSLRLVSIHPRPYPKRSKEDRTIQLVFPRLRETSKLQKRVFDDACDVHGAHASRFGFEDRSFAQTRVSEANERTR